MIIVCPTCSASYDIPATSLGATGRSVRCTSCKTVWFNPPAETDDIISERGPKVPPVVNLSSEPDSPKSKAALAEERVKQQVGFVPPASTTIGKRKGGDDFEPDAVTGKNQNVMADAVNAPVSMPVAASAPVADAEARDGATDAVVVEPKVKSGEKRGWFRRKKEGGRASVPRAAKEMQGDKAQKTPLWMTMCLLCGVAGLFWMVAKRDAVAAFLPEMAHIYRAVGLDVNVQGLNFENVKTLESMQDGTPLLVIEGVIKNVTTHGVDIPRLRLAVQTQEGRELFAWTAAPAQPKLERGEEIPFKAQLASPPLDGKRVAVRFVTRFDNMMRKD